MEFRVLTPKEERICKQNLYELSVLFRIRKTLVCKNCSFPLSQFDDNFFSLFASGKICDLCHSLENAAAAQPGLKAAHEAWKADQASKKKMLDSDKYF